MCDRFTPFEVTQLNTLSFRQREREREGERERERVRERERGNDFHNNFFLKYDYVDDGSGIEYLYIENIFYTLTLS